VMGTKPLPGTMCPTIAVNAAFITGTDDPGPGTACPTAGATDPRVT